jgi:predicted RNA-binding protein YlxR (DUF448 family)
VNQSRGAPSAPAGRQPERTCVQCGAKDAKGELLRVAGKPRQGWRPDPRGILPGRGIYLCRREPCVSGFVKRLGTPKGRARLGMGPQEGPELARALEALWREEM